MRKQQCISKLSEIEAVRLLSEPIETQKKEYAEVKFFGCAVCGKKYGLEIHHVSYVEDIRLRLCRSCHYRVHFGTGLGHLNPVGKKWSFERLAKLDRIGNIKLPDGVYDTKMEGYRQLIKEVLKPSSKV